MKACNWFFHWVGGGYNSVRASSKREAIENAKNLARFTKLIPDEKSFLRDPQQTRTFAEDKKYAGMFD